jgi:beta-lactamase regulating signal transducer with metallopeptidase domain
MTSFLGRWISADMAQAWLPLFLSWTVKGTLLLAAAGAVTLAMRRSSAAARHLVWSLAIAGVCTLPFLSLGLPAWQALPALPTDQGFQGASRAGDAALPPRDPVGTGSIDPAPRVVASTSGGAPRSGEAVAPAPGTAIAGAVEGTGLRVLPLAAWAAGAIVLLAMTAVGAISLRRLRITSERLVTGPLAALLADLCRDLGMRRPLLLLSRRRAMPMTWGILRPRVLLPAAAMDWPLERCRQVLLHELAHVRRRDCLWELMARAARAVHWFNPLVWIACRRMAVERERACDDLVLTHGSRPADYADHLLRIASSLPSGWLSASAAIAMARPSRLEARLVAILDERCNRREPTRARKLLALAVLSGLVLPLAMVAEDAPRSRRRTSASPPGEAAETDHCLTGPRAVLPDGVLVELVGVSRGPPTEGSSWRPDGAALEGLLGFEKTAEAPFRVSLRVRGAAGKEVTARSEWTSKGVPRWTDAETTREQAWFEGTLPGDEAGTRTACIFDAWTAGVAPLPDDDTLDLRVGVAAGAWQAFAAADSRGSRTVARDAASGVVFQAAEVETTQVVVRAMDTLGDREDHRFVAVDIQGKTHAPAWSKVDLLPGARLTTLAFRDVDLGAVKEFRLETRPFHRVVFRNISLAGERRTKVEAAADAGPAGAELRFVRLVVAQESMTFEGEPIPLDALEDRLRRVPDRAGTVIEVGVSGADVGFARFNAVLLRVLELQKDLGFKSTSQVGEQPLGSKGSPPAPATGPPEEGARREERSDAPRGWCFGSVVERTISGDRGEWMLDLDSGRTHGPVVIGGESSMPEAMDLSFVHAPSEKGLRPTTVAALELQFRRGKEEDWDLDPGSLDWRLAVKESPGPAQGQPDPSGPRTAPLVTAQDDLPATFIFRTRQGADGVLQVSSMTDNEVKIRYRKRARRIDPSSPAFQGQAINVGAGEIRAADCLRFLADHTGLSVIVNAPAAFRKPIHMPVDMENVGGDTIIKLLQANGIRVERRRLPDGEEVLVASME